MRNIENEEILIDKVNKYYESEEFGEYARKWANTTYDFFFDFCVLNLNVHWLVTKLSECRDIDIYISIIRRYEELLSNDTYIREENIAYINKRLSENRKAFFRKLSGMIADYCLR